jgi:tRNA-Thr(GGU) m(6)t(6)A37 methyltransferase TsaA
VITLFPRRNFEQALEDLEGFERIWVVTWFDRATSWKPKILPPRCRRKRGLFATRSPHRPNPIGLSLCTLIEIKGRTVRVENPDLLDGTPVLDLKPYLPGVEAFPHARAGWVEALDKEQPQPFTIEFRSLASQQLAWLKSEHRIDLRPRIQTVLGRDPHPHPYRRIKTYDDGSNVLSIRSWRIFFRIQGACVVVERIASGYPAGVGNAAHEWNTLHDGEAHRAFHRLWP